MSWMLDRRNFIKAATVGGVGVAAQALAIALWERAAQAAPLPGCGFWGDLIGNIGGWTCATHTGFKVLDIYLYGGASQWETLWLPGNGGGVPGFTAHDMGDPESRARRSQLGGKRRTVSLQQCRPAAVTDRRAVLRGTERRRSRLLGSARQADLSPRRHSLRAAGW